jgi:branched-chain amino acid transport system substrate-binding protein
MPVDRIARFAATFLTLVVLTSARGAADLGPVRIGIIYAFSSNANSPLGPRFNAAVGAWVKEHGDSVAGRKVQLILRDEGGVNPENAKRLAQELVVQEHVDMLAGLILTPNAVAAGEISTQSKTPLMILNATTSGILAPNPYELRDSYTTAQITAPLALWAWRHGAKTAYVLFEDYGPGIDAGTTFEKTFTAAGGKIVGEIRIPTTTLEYAPYIQHVKDDKPDVTYVFLNSAGGAPTFLREWANAGLPRMGVKLLAHGSMVEEDALPGLGDAAIGVISSMNYTPSHASNLNRTFVADYLSAFGRNPQLPAATEVAAYDAMNLIYRAVAAQKGELTAEGTVAAIKGARFESPRGPVLIDPQTRDIVQNVYIRRVERKGSSYVNTEIETVPMARDPFENALPSPARD